MKKKLLAGIMTLVFAGTCVPTAFADSFAIATNKSAEISYAYIDNSTSNSNGPQIAPQVNKPVNNPTWGTVVVKPDNNNGIYKNPNGRIKGNKHKPHKNHKPNEYGKHKVKPNKPDQGSYKPNNPSGVYKPNRPNNGTYKPNNPSGVYKPNRPNNGTYKPVKPSTGSRTKVHGAHWCYGACSLHDAGLHNAPRTQKHWCDGYR